MKNYDVIIIGSGFSSLIAAAILNKHHQKVLILEQHYKLGGYLHSFKRKNYEFETGAHYTGCLSPGQTFHKILNYLELFDNQYFIPMNKDGFDRFVYPSFEVNFYSNYHNTIDSIVSVFPRERVAVQYFFEKIRQAAQLFPTYELSVDLDSSQLMPYLDISLLDVIKKFTSNLKLQTVLCSYCGLHGVPPNRIPFGLHAVLTDSLLKSAYLFRKGGQGLVDFIVTKLKSRGVDFLESHQVNNLTVHNKSVTHLRCTNETTFTANKFISGIHPKNLFELLSDKNFKPAFKSRLNSMEESMGISSLYLVSKDISAFEKDKNFYYMETENPMEVVYRNAKYSPLFLSCPNKSEQNHANTFSAHVFTPIEIFASKTESGWKKKSNYSELKNILVMNMLEQINRYHPEFSNNIIYKEASTPVTNIRYNGSVNGSAYGILHSMENTGIRSLGPNTHLNNLYLSGQNTLLPGVLGAAISGLRTAGHLVGIKNIIKDINKGC